MDDVPKKIWQRGFLSSFKISTHQLFRVGENNLEVIWIVGI
jgi:hypothetical protein